MSQPQPCVNLTVKQTGEGLGGYSAPVDRILSRSISPWKSGRGDAHVSYSHCESVMAECDSYASGGVSLMQGTWWHHHHMAFSQTAVKHACTHTHTPCYTYNVESCVNKHTQKPQAVVKHGSWLNFPVKIQLIKWQ